MAIYHIRYLFAYNLEIPAGVYPHGQHLLVTVWKPGLHFGGGDGGRCGGSGDRRGLHVGRHADHPAADRRHGDHDERWHGADGGGHHHWRHALLLA